MCGKYSHQLVSCGGGNDLHVRVAVLGNSSDRGGGLVGVGSLNGLGRLLSCFHGLVPKMDDILSSIREQLLAKTLEVAVNQRHGTCITDTA